MLDPRAFETNLNFGKPAQRFGSKLRIISGYATHLLMVYSGMPHPTFTNIRTRPFFHYDKPTSSYTPTKPGTSTNDSQSFLINGDLFEVTIFRYARELTCRTINVQSAALIESNLDNITQDIPVRVTSMLWNKFGLITSIIAKAILSIKQLTILISCNEDHQ